MFDILVDLFFGTNYRKEKEYRDKWRNLRDKYHQSILDGYKALQMQSEYQTEYLSGNTENAKILEQKYREFSKTLDERTECLREERERLKMEEKFLFRNN